MVLNLYRANGALSLLIMLLFFRGLQLLFFVRFYPEPIAFNYILLKPATQSLLYQHTQYLY